MGNTESSSSSSSSRGNQSRKYGQAQQENSYITAIKIGAAAVGLGVVAISAWNFLRSSDDSDDSDGSADQDFSSSRSRGFDHTLSEGRRLSGSADQGFRSSSRSRGFDHTLSEGRRLSGEPKTHIYLEGSHGSGLTRNNNQSPELLRTLKIMTYNVWFKEDAKVDERMKAIGGLILQHKPDIIFFQEVTSIIYDIFQNFSWWEAYECSVSPLKATKKYFCMMLSKIPVDKWKNYPFKNSSKKLCTAKIDVGNGLKLIVATSHLKSPNPPMMHRQERASQAKKVLGILNLSKDVIFGGDMNWDEETDGQFPLLEDWVDAWTQLRPGEDGSTFDTESNPMLTGKKPLQKRLDRFICKLKNFELLEIEMIGMDAIPGIYYPNNMKMQPVLPSDHYGLLLTIRNFRTIIKDN